MTYKPTFKDKNPNHRIYKSNYIWMLKCLNTEGETLLKHAQAMGNKCPMCLEVLK